MDLEDVTINQAIQSLSQEIEAFRQRTEILNAQLNLVSGESTGQLDVVMQLQAFRTAFHQHVEEMLEEMQASLDELLLQQEVLVEAQTLLAAERQRYQDLFTFSPAAFVVTDRFGIVQETNRAARRLLGLSESSAMCSKQFAMFLMKGDQRHCRQQISRLSRGEAVASWEVQLWRSSDREIIPASLTVNALCIEETIQLYWLVQDLRQQKEAEAYLADKTGVLERLVQQRTDALAALNAGLHRSLQRRAKMEEDLQLQVEQERMLETVAQKIRGSLDLGDVLATTVEEIRQFLKIDRVVVFRFKPNKQGVVTAESVSEDFTPIGFSTFDDPCFYDNSMAYFQPGKFRAIADIENSDLHECHRELLRGFNVRALLTIPLSQGEKIWGLLILHHCRDVRVWEPGEISLVQRLATQVAIALKQSELHEQVQRLAVTDALTQVANRYRLEAYLEECWNRLMREGKPLSFVLCDIDLFKQYNDAYGHLAGDRCLRQVADLLSSQVKRPADLVARYGGEEFAIVLPDTDRGGAEHLVRQLQQRLEAAKITHPDSPEGRLTLSFGIATIIPNADEKMFTLVNRADKVLYQVKRQGRDGWRAWA